MLTLVNMLVIGSHGLNTYIFVTIVPSVVIDLGGREYMFWLFALFQVGTITAGILTSSLINQFSAKSVFIIAIGMVIAGSLAGGSATQLSAAILGRGLQGLGEGMLLSFCYILIAQRLPPQLLSKIFALNSSMWSVAAALGPLLAGVLDEFISWRASFFINIPLMVLLLILAWPMISAHKITQEFVPTPFRRAALLAIGLVAICSVGQFPGLLLKTTILGLGLATLYAFYRVDKISASPLLPAKIFNQFTAVGRALVLLSIIPISTAAANVYLGSFLRSIWSLSALQAGYALSVIAFAWTTAALLTRGISNPINQKRSVQVGVATLISGQLLVASGVFSSNLLLVCIGFAVMGMGLGASNQFLRKSVITSAKEIDKSVTSGAINPLTFGGAVIGAGVSGVAASAFGLFNDRVEGQVFSVSSATNNGSVMLLSFITITVVAFLLSFRLTKDQFAISSN